MVGGASGKRSIRDSRDRSKITRRSRRDAGAKHARINYDEDIRDGKGKQAGLGVATRLVASYDGAAGRQLQR